MDYAKELEKIRRGDYYKPFGLSKEPFYLTTDVNDFIGREKEQQLLLRAIFNMASGLMNQVAILGYHGIGKTAFMEYTYNRIKDLVKNMGFSRSYYISGLADFKELLSPDGPILTEAKLKPAKAIIFIDDLDVIFNRNKHAVLDLYSYTNINIVGTWNSSEWDKMKRDPALRVPNSEVVYLGPLNKEECIAIINKRLANVGIKGKTPTFCDDFCIQQIVDFSRGNPFSLITHCRRLLQYMILNKIDSCNKENFIHFVENDLMKGKKSEQDIKLTNKQFAVFDFIMKKVEVTAEDIAKEFNISRSAAVQQLKNIENSGLLNSKRKGRKVWYFVPTDIVYGIDDTLTRIKE